MSVDEQEAALPLIFAFIQPILSHPTVRGMEPDVSLGSNHRQKPTRYRQGEAAAGALGGNKGIAGCLGSRS